VHLPSLEKGNVEKTAKLAELATSMKRLDGMTFTVAAKAAEGKLFGSVTVADIVAAAKAADIEIIDDMVNLEHPINDYCENLKRKRNFIY
jgi:ribosomal protein L9